MYSQEKSGQSKIKTPKKQPNQKNTQKTKQQKSKKLRAIYANGCLAFGLVLFYFVFVVFSFWYTFAVLNVLLRVAKNEWDVRYTEKADFTVC